MKVLVLLKNILRFLGAFTLCILVVILAMQIFNRNIIGKSFVWVEELAGISMIYLTFLGSALATLNNSNTRIDFFIKLLPLKGTIIAAMISDFVSVCFLFILGRYCLKAMANNMHNLTPAMKLPVSFQFFGMFIGIFFMIWFFGFRFYLKILELRSKDISSIEEALQ